MLLTSRIRRGFHRVGVVLAAPLILASVTLAGHEVWLQRTTLDPYAPQVNTAPARKPSNVFDQFDPPAAVPQRELFDDLIPSGSYYRPDFTGASVALCLALALYAAARAAGWVIAGFMASDERPSP